MNCRFWWSLKLMGDIFVVSCIRYWGWFCRYSFTYRFIVELKKEKKHLASRYNNRKKLNCILYRSCCFSDRWYFWRLVWTNFATAARTRPGYFDHALNLGGTTIQK
jgi:hypothetical protein